MMATQEPGSSGIMQEQVKELLASLRNMKKDTAAVIDKKMKQLKRELAEERKAANTQLAKKNRLEKTPYSGRRATKNSSSTARSYPRRYQRQRTPWSAPRR